MKLKPLEDKVLVKLKEQGERKTKAGLIEIERKTETVWAEVIEKGELVTDLKIGDTVLIDRYSGQEVNLDQEKHIVIKESAIMGVEDKNV